MKNVADYYNKTATGWSEQWYKERLKSPVLKKFFSVFADGGTKRPKILELGCGAGYDSKVLNTLGARTVGVDLSEKLIEIAKNHIPESKFFVGDITDTFDKLGRFDGVLCLATIMHVDVTKMADTFLHFADALKKGGLLLVSSFDGVGKNYEKSYANIEGDEYDKNFNNYNATELCAFAYPKLKLVDTWMFDDFAEGWRYYIFRKV